MGFDIHLQFVYIVLAWLVCSLIWGRTGRRKPCWNCFSCLERVREGHTGQWGAMSAYSSVCLYLNYCRNCLEPVVPSCEVCQLSGLHVTVGSAEASLGAGSKHGVLTFTHSPPWLCSLCFSPQDAGGQQIGFLLGSCGIALALTSEICLKGLPKTQNGEIVQFKGE